MTKNNKPKLVLIRGLPGSGKSTISDALKDEFHDKVTLLDPDATDYDSQEYKDFSALKKSEMIEEKFHPYRFLREQAYRAIDNNQIVVWNQAFTNLDGLQKTIVNLENYAKENGEELPVLIVEVVIDIDIAKKRVFERASKGGHDVADTDFDRFINDYRSFKDEGFNVIEVNGKDKIRDIVAKITDKINNL